MRVEKVELLKRWQEALSESEQVPFSQLLVMREGKVVYEHVAGWQDVEGREKATTETVSRFFSMTKPVASVGLMMLYEEGKFQLDDPVYLYLGNKWRKQNMKVFEKNSDKMVQVEKHITIRMLLTHTSGLSYGFDRVGMVNKVDQMYFKGDSPFLSSKGEVDKRYKTLEEFIDALAEMPLVFQPGTGWNYGYNVEVVGRLIEVISKTDLRSFLKSRILDPLEMHHTDFFPSAEDARVRFASLYMRKGTSPGMLVRPGSQPKHGLHKLPPEQRNFTSHQTLFKAGEGLVSTCRDYAKFCNMLLHDGQCPNTKVRVLSRMTIRYMTSNQLFVDDYETLRKTGGGFGAVQPEGMGFGLGFAVVNDVRKSRMQGSVGNYAWAGAASTLFWVDPVEKLVVVFATQLMFRDPLVLPLKAMLSSLIYGSLERSFL